MKQARSKSKAKSTPRRQKKTMRLVGVTLIILISMAAAFLLIPKDRDPLPTPPQISTEGLDGPVVELLKEIEANVAAAPQDDMAWGTLGMMLRAHGYDREASDCFRVAQRLNANEPRWPYHLAHTLLERDQEEALQHLRRTVALLEDDNDYPRLLLGRLLVERGQLDEAERLIKAWLNKDPQHAGARLLQAQIQFAREQWETSARSLRMCLTNRFTARLAYSLLGQISLRLGHPEDSAKANEFVQALPEDNLWPDPYEQELMAFRVSRRHLIETVPILLSQNERDEAQRLTKQLLEDYPEAAEGWLYQGRIDYLNEDWTAAEKALRRHLEMEPDSVDGLMQLGQLRLGQNQPAEAVTHFTKIVQLKPDSHIAYYQLGEAQLRIGETNAAMQSLHQAIQCEPAFMESYLRLANLHFRFGEKEEALQQINQAMRINPYDMRLQEALDILQGE